MCILVIWGMGRHLFSLVYNLKFEVLQSTLPRLIVQQVVSSLLILVKVTGFEDRLSQAIC